MNKIESAPFFVVFRPKHLILLSWCNRNQKTTLQNRKKKKKRFVVDRKSHVTLLTIHKWSIPQPVCDATVNRICRVSVVRLGSNVSLHFRLCAPFFRLHVFSSILNHFVLKSIRQTFIFYSPFCTLFASVVNTMAAFFNCFCFTEI